MIRSYDQIKALLLESVDPGAAGILAEPVISDTSREVDWYAPAGTVSKYTDLPVEKRNAIDDKIARLHKSISSIAEKLEGHDQAAIRSATFILQSLKIPNLSSIYVVNDEPVLINWGMVPTGAQADLEVLRGIADARQAREKKYGAPLASNDQNMDVAALDQSGLRKNTNYIVINDPEPLLPKIVLIFLLLIMFVLIADMLLENCAIGLPRFISGDQTFTLLDFCESTNHRLESFQELTNEMYRNQTTQ